MTYETTLRSSGGNLALLQTLARCLSVAGWLATLVLIPVLTPKGAGPVGRAWMSFGVLMGMSALVALLLGVRGAVSPSAKSIPTTFALLLVAGGAAYFAHAVAQLTYAHGTPVFAATGLAVLGCFSGGFAVLLSLDSVLFRAPAHQLRQSRATY